MISSRLNLRPPLASRHYFTMIELLVAMGVLALLMLMLVQFFGGAQTVWTQTATNTRVYENARVALELIQRDLECAIASNLPGREIPFYGGDYSGGTPPETVFVAATTLPGTGAKSKLCEIRYYVVGNILMRQCINDSAAGSWNFFGNTANWQNNGNTGDEIVSGIVNNGVQLRCFDATGTAITGSVNVLPAYIQISVTVFDEKLTDLSTELGTAWQERVDQSKRTFTKILTLGQE